MIINGRKATSDNLAAIRSMAEGSKFWSIGNAGTIDHQGQAVQIFLITKKIAILRFYK